MNTLSFRLIALIVLLPLVSSCSTSATTPPSKNTTVSNVRVHHSDKGPCPPSGILFAVGNNGTYTVAVGDKCVMYAPYDQTCIPGISGQDGLTYTFEITSGGSNGTLAQSGNKGTFTRSSSGEVDISLQETEYGQSDSCKPTMLTYGTITFKT